MISAVLLVSATLLVVGLIIYIVGLRKKSSEFQAVGFFGINASLYLAVLLLVTWLVGGLFSEMYL